MKGEFCSGCGHLLPRNRIRCTFCGWMQEDDAISNLTQNFNKEKNFVYDYTPVFLPLNAFDVSTKIRGQLDL